MTTFDTLEEKAFQKHCGKRRKKNNENAGNQYFLFFPQCFLSYETQL